MKLWKEQNQVGQFNILGYSRTLSYLLSVCTSEFTKIVHSAAVFGVWTGPALPVAPTCKNTRSSNKP